MSMRQAIAWIDEREAQILRLEDGIHCEQTIAAPEGTSLPDQTPGSPATPSAPNVFFGQIAAALKTAGEILVVGPSEIKRDFVNYMHKKDHGFDARILGVETVEHPDDHQLVGYANRYFTEGGPRRSGHGSGYNETD
jgi:stalled ribosome rescue protein Dom34